jgi:ankyrin repeat protein
MLVDDSAQKDALTAFLDAINENDEKKAAALLQEGLNPDTRNRYDNPLLNVAVMFHRSGIVAQLLKAGADVTATGVDGQTALHYAAPADNDTLVRQLLDAGVPPAQPDARGRTAMELAWAESVKKALTPGT